MANELKDMPGILEAFRRPIPVESSNGVLTVPDLLGFLNEAAPGFAIECEVQGEYVNVSLTINWLADISDSVGAVSRQGLAAIQDGDVVAAHETALLRSAELWGLTAQSADAPSVDRLLKEVDLT